MVGICNRRSGCRVTHVQVRGTGIRELQELLAKRDLLSSLPAIFHCVRKASRLRYRNTNPVRQTTKHDDSAGSAPGTAKSSGKKESRTAEKDGPERQKFHFCSIRVLPFRIP